ncbi:hypothetical protein CMEL01_10130, partial [Colletotrichum melonis]
LIIVVVALEVSRHTQLSPPAISGKQSFSFLIPCRHPRGIRRRSSLPPHPPSHLISSPSSRRGPFLSLPLRILSNGHRVPALFGNPGSDHTTVLSAFVYGVVRYTTSYRTDTSPLDSLLVEAG